MPRSDPPRAARARVAALVLLLLSSLGVVPALAQEDSGLVGAIPVRFSLVPPGARSLAMGGAFVGFADDATAAWTNPAGLTSLARTEVAIEGRRTETPSESLELSVVEGTGADPRRTRLEIEDSSVDSLSFVSWTYPREQWTAGVFYHRLADQSLRGTGGGGFVGGEAFSSVSAFDLGISGAGASLAVRLSDAVSLGLTLVEYEIALDSVFDSLRGATKNTTRRVVGDDRSLGGIVGLLWTGQRFQIGAVYRIGPEFDADSTLTCGGTLHPGPSQDPRDPDCFERPVGFVVDSRPSVFRVPDSMGIGLAWRPTPQLSIGLDVIHTTYSDLAEGATAVFTRKRARFEIEDSTEPHLGIEWRIPLRQERQLFLRAGAWQEEDHRLVYVRPAPGSPAFSPTLDRLYPAEQGPDETHYSFGLGWTTGVRFQLDAAADFSDPVDVYSVSAVCRF